MGMKWETWESWHFRLRWKCWCLENPGRSHAARKKLGIQAGPQNHLDVRQHFSYKRPLGVFRCRPLSAVSRPSGGSRAHIPGDLIHRWGLWWREIQCSYEAWILLDLLFLLMISYGLLWSLDFYMYVYVFLGVIFLMALPKGPSCLAISEVDPRTRSTKPSASQRGAGSAASQESHSSSGFA